MQDDYGAFFGDRWGQITSTPGVSAVTGKR
jgi:hypothetical protein